MKYETAEALPREDSAQGQFFHCSPQQVCDELGLNWIAAMRLFESGWLSFNPAKVVEMGEGQEAEFRFLGALAAAGCDDRMLAILLKTLQKPYRYNLGRIYYDMHRRAWVQLPRLSDRRENMLQKWIEELAEEQDKAALLAIRSAIDKELASMYEFEQIASLF